MLYKYSHTLYFGPPSTDFFMSVPNQVTFFYYFFNFRYIKLGIILQNFIPEKCIHNSPYTTAERKNFCRKETRLDKRYPVSKGFFLAWLLAFVKLSKKPTM